MADDLTDSETSQQSSSSKRGWWKIGRSEQAPASPEERQLAAAQREHEAAVKGAEDALKRVQKEQQARVKDTERALRGAEDEYGDRVKAAEKSLRDGTRSAQHRIEDATDAIAKAQKLGTKRLDHKGKVHLNEDRIETPEGTSYFSEGPVKATVDTAGNLQLSHRHTPEPVKPSETVKFG